jgi:hypothetical protein
MHAGELSSLIAGGLRSSAWGRKKACAEALSAMAAAAGEALGPHAPGLTAALLPEATAGRLWDGKEALVAALGALAAACAPALAADPGVPRLVAALMSAAGRRKAGYRAAALAALRRLLEALGDAADKGAPIAGSEGVYAEVAPPLLAAVRAHATAPPPAAKPASSGESGGGGDEGGGDEGADRPPPPMPLAESLACLAAAWRLTPPDARAAGGGALFGALGAVLARPGTPWASWLAATGAADEVLKACARDSGGGAALAWLAPLLRGLAFCLTHTNVSQVWGCLREGGGRRVWRRRLSVAVPRRLHAGVGAAPSSTRPVSFSLLPSCAAASWRLPGVRWTLLRPQQAARRAQHSRRRWRRRRQRRAARLQRLHQRQRWKRAVRAMPWRSTRVRWARSSRPASSLLWTTSPRRRSRRQPRGA